MRVHTPWKRQRGRLLTGRRPRPGCAGCDAAWGRFFQPHFIVRLQCFYGFPGRDAAPNMRCRMEGFSVFRRTQRRSLHKKPAPVRGWRTGDGRICNAGRIPLWEKWRIGPAEHAAGVFFYGWVTVIYPYLGRSSFQRGEMISILNWPEKLIHIFFEKPVTCSPYSVSLTDAWTF